MPFDSNGVFSRVMNWTSDQQNGIAIECGRHDAEDDNFAEGFSECFCRDGRAAATGDFNLGQHKIQNLASGTATTDAVNKGQLDTGLSAKANTTDVVNLTGTQTISGTKTFTSDPYIKNIAPKLYMDDTQQTKGTAPSSDVWNSIDFRDTNGNMMGRCRQLYTTSKINRVELQVYKANSSGDTDYAYLGIRYPASGDPYTYAPASDVIDSIVTTIGIHKATNGYFQLGNGMIVQWGRVTGITSNTETTVTFPKAFSSATSYTIVKNYQSNRQSEATDREISFYSMTATSAKTFTASDDTNSFSWLAIGY